VLIQFIEMKIKYKYFKEQIFFPADILVLVEYFLVVYFLFASYFALLVSYCPLLWLLLHNLIFWLLCNSMQAAFNEGTFQKNRNQKENDIENSN